MHDSDCESAQYQCITKIKNAYIYTYIMCSFRSTKCTWLNVVIAVGSETAGANPAEAERLAQGK